MNKKVYVSIYEYACERRELDARKICDFLRINSYEIVIKPEQADIIIFISCGIIEKNTNACLDHIKTYQKYKARLIVGGCGPGIDKERIEAIHKGPVFVTKDLNHLDTLFPNEVFRFSDMDDAAAKFSMLDRKIFGSQLARAIRVIPFFRFIFTLTVKKILSRRYGPFSFILLKTFGLEKEYYIKIADGCLGTCSYCALSDAIGTLKSKPLDVCLHEFNKGLDQGFKNFYLTADDTGAYGLDIGCTLIDLLRKVTDANGDYTILISSFNSVWLCMYINELEAIVKKGKIKSIVIPVQSGNKNVLEGMSRFSEVDKIKDAIWRLKKACPTVWLSTHLIVGFPGESESAFHDTLEFATTTPFDEIQVFAFSLKPGTKAQDIKHQISEATIAARMKEAHTFFKKKKYACYRHKYDLLYASAYSPKALR